MVKHLSETNTMRFIALVVIISMFIMVNGCVPGFGPTVTGSGKMGTLDMDYSDFTNVEVGYAFQVDITSADSYLVRLTVDDNLYEYLDISKRGDTLHIRLKPDHNYISTTRKATISLPDLRRLGLSGASKASVSGFSSTHSLDFDLSGASRVDISNLKTDDTLFEVSGASKVSGDIEMTDGRFDLSGGSSLELRGSANDVSIKSSGGSNLMLHDFSIVDAKVNLSGASNATVNASGSVGGDLSGGSKLYYTGNPTQVSVNASGGSTMSRK